MEIKKCILTKNDCYKKGSKMTPKGIVVHSTGANNTSIARYVQPDDGLLGKNKYDNDWNRSGVSKCVHAFIGKDKNGDIRTYQTLPFDMKCWGCASGPKGSYNSTHIQFEICEDGLKDEKYFNKVMKEAIDFCVYLCKTYNIKVSNVVSHLEAHDAGYASNHGDPDYWLKKFGKSMKWFREQVSAGLKSATTTTTTTKKPTTTTTTTKKTTTTTTTKKTTTTTTKKTTTAAKVSYYPKYNGTSVSIVDILGSMKVDNSFSFRKKIAVANGIKLYAGTASQNKKLCDLAKAGKLIKP